MMQLQETYPAWELWLEELPVIVGRLIEQWDIELGAWLADGTNHAVWRVKAGRVDAVLKISRPGKTVVHESASLSRCFSARVPVAAPLRVSQDGRALLTAYVESSPPPVWTAHTAAQLLDTLKQVPADGFVPLPHVIEPLRAEAAVRAMPENWALLMKAFEQLWKEPHVALHGNLTSEHLLWTADGFRIIAPHGLYGPAAYDYAMLGWQYDLSTSPWEHGRHRELAQLGGIDQQHVDAWVAIQLACAKIEGTFEVDDWLDHHWTSSLQAIVGS